MTTNEKTPLQFSGKTPLILDVEIYKNYFLLSMLHAGTGKVRNFELFGAESFDRAELSRIMHGYLTIGFNSNHFDLVLIAMAIAGKPVEAIKRACDAIIVKKLAPWRVLKDFGMTIPKGWNHIDLIDVAPGQAGLKIYGGRMGTKTIQDLPIEPNALITPADRDQLVTYCANDLNLTLELAEKLRPEIELRENMSAQYGIDLRSKSDAQIAETVIKSAIYRMTGVDNRAPDLGPGYSFQYQDPKIINFTSPELRDLYSKIRAHEFTLLGNGSPKNPDFLKNECVVIGGRKYQMGIGGLHSCEKSQFIAATDDMILADLDVASYYPNIILQQNLAPRTLGKPFLDTYSSIVKTRIGAKRAGDKVTAETLKICVNGSFGKFGSKFSPLYSPDLLIQTTITGQLALLMLIEKLTDAAIDVVSANTDGIVVYHHKSKSELVESIAWDWQLETSYTLERNEYRAIASRDVNNYVAVTTGGKLKGKGCFATAGLKKNPDQSIIYTAVANFIAHGTPIKETILKCSDIREFVTVRMVKGGAVWRDEKLGKATRFYVSSEVGDDEAIRYVINGNKVPKSAGCRPLMTIPDALPTDINYGAYIAAAEKLLKEVGYNA